MSIKVKYGTLEISKFPAGESKVVYMCGLSTKEVITLDWDGNEDLFNLALVVDAIRNTRIVSTVHLEMPYIPYARQDRICNYGESLSIKVVATFINSLKLDQVVVCDSHSDVALALFDNLAHNTLSQCAIASIPREVFANAVLVSPDTGAMKKVLTLGKEVGCRVEVATKQRDITTGTITNTNFSGRHVGNQDFIIVDDICEGGYTFTELAKVLKHYTDGKIYLYVTHGIFSKGYKVFDNLIDGIYTYNLMGEPHPLILTK